MMSHIMSVSGGLVHPETPEPVVPVDSTTCGPSPRWGSGFGGAVALVGGPRAEEARAFGALESASQPSAQGMAQ